MIMMMTGAAERRGLSSEKEDQLMKMRMMARLTGAVLNTELQQKGK